MKKTDDGGSRAEGETSSGNSSHTVEPKLHGLLQAWLLLFLGEQESHGYDLVRQLAAELPTDMLPDPAVIYRILRRLEREGAVASNLRPGVGGPARKVYTLTGSGKTRLEGWRRTAEERAALLTRFIDRLAAFTEGSS